MNTPAHHLPHLLRDDPGHGVHRLEKCANPLGKIRNLDSVPGAEQHHHRLADHPSEPEQNGRDDPGK